MKKITKIICCQWYIVRQYIKVQRLANKYYVILIFLIFLLLFLLHFLLLNKKKKMKKKKKKKMERDKSKRMALNSTYKKWNFYIIEVSLDLYEYIVWTIMWVIETFVHVMIGTAFIGVGLWRVLAYHFSENHHLGLESSILYWHFVDIVWLILFISIYYWGS